MTTGRREVVKAQELPPMEDMRRIFFSDEYNIWKSKFFADKDGNIFEFFESKAYGEKVYKRKPQGSKYKGESLYLRIKMKVFCIHNLVWCAWNGVPYERNLIVKHKDGDKLNNRPENLELYSRKKIIKRDKGGKKEEVDITPKFQSMDEYKRDYEKSDMKLAPKEGRVPYIFNDEIQERIISYIRIGAHVETAVLAAGISKNAFYTWLKRGHSEPDGPYGLFVEKLNKAVAESEMVDIARINDAAKKNWNAAAWKLERKFTKRWGKTLKDETFHKKVESLKDEVKVQEIDLEKLSDEELDVLEGIYSRMKKDKIEKSNTIDVESED